jgi:poly-gamma-glutamate capsule biosynthesis protein CapA/YwtB (metallophosphatase superfamily)
MVAGNTPLEFRHSQYNILMASLAFVGDLMLVGSLAPRIEKGWDPFEKVRPLLQKADLCIGNLEGMPASGGAPTPHKSAAELKSGTHYVLKGPPKAARLLHEAGFDLLTCANNHAMDYGWTAANECLSYLNRFGMCWCGVGKTLKHANKPAFLHAGDLKFAFLSYLAFRSWKGIRACTPAGDTVPGVSYLPPADTSVPNATAKKWLKADIHNARQQADFVVVCFHWGMEGETQPNEYQRALARTSIQYGASAVIGHHPHVLQPVEAYQKCPIAYSLGNFVASRCAGKLGESMILYLTFQKESTPTIKKVPVRILNGAPTV